MRIHRRLIFYFIAVAFLIGLPIQNTAFGVNTAALVKKSVTINKTSVKKPLKTNTNTFTLIISNGIKGCLGSKGKTLVKKELIVNSKKDLLTQLKENSEVIETGGFIKYINGLKGQYPVPESQMTNLLKEKGVMGVDWFIYQNNKKALVGAGQIYPKKGDVIMVDYHYWNKDEFNVNNN